MNGLVVVVTCESVLERLPERDVVRVPRRRNFADDAVVGGDQVVEPGLNGMARIGVFSQRRKRTQPDPCVGLPLQPVHDEARFSSNRAGDGSSESRLLTRTNRRKFGKTLAMMSLVPMSTMTRSGRSAITRSRCRTVLNDRSPPTPRLTNRNRLFCGRFVQLVDPLVRPPRRRGARAQAGHRFDRADRSPRAAEDLTQHLGRGDLRAKAEARRRARRRSRRGAPTAPRPVPSPVTAAQEPSTSTAVPMRCTLIGTSYGLRRGRRRRSDHAASSSPVNSVKPGPSRSSVEIRFPPSTTQACGTRVPGCARNSSTSDTASGIPPVQDRRKSRRPSGIGSR